MDGIYNTYLVNTKLFTNYASDSGSTNLANKTGYRALEAGLTFKLGADWYPNKSNTIGFKIDGGPGLYNEVGNGSNHVTGYNNTGFDHLHFAEDGHNNWNTQNYNLNAEHQFDTSGTVLDFSADYVGMKEIDRSFYSNYFYDVNDNDVLLPNIYQNRNNSTSKIFSSKFDFIHPIDTTSSLEAGIKGSFTNMVNAYLFERKNPATSLFYNDTNLFQYLYLFRAEFCSLFQLFKIISISPFASGCAGGKQKVNGASAVNAIKFSKITPVFSQIFPLNIHVQRNTFFN